MILLNKILFLVVEVMELLIKKIINGMDIHHL